MSENKLASLCMAAHQQRRRVEALQHQLYSQPGVSSHLLEELSEAETALHQLEEEIKTMRPPESTGVLLHTQPETNLIFPGAGAPIELQILQRQSHVPSSIVHWLNPAETPLVTLRIRSHSDNFLRLKITIFVENYSAQTVNTIELAYQATSETHHLPTFFPERLQTLSEPTRATIHIRIDNLAGGAEHYSTFPIWLLAHSGAPNGIKDPASGHWIDLTPYLIAWITPGSEAIQQLLQRARQLHPLQRIAGYQSEAVDVEAQVQAIYDALSAERISFASTMLPFGDRRKIHSQPVHLPRQTLQTRSANALDGTILFASVLEAASLNPAVVIIPGHAFLAWETQLTGGSWDYLETTLAGAHDFSAAQAKGRALAAEYRTLVERFQDNQYFQLLPISDLRIHKNILPIE